LSSIRNLYHKEDLDSSENAPKNIIRGISDRETYARDMPGRLQDVDQGYRGGCLKRGHGCRDNPRRPSSECPPHPFMRGYVSERVVRPTCNIEIGGNVRVTLDLEGVPSFKGACAAYSMALL